MDCSLPGSSIHGIFTAKVLEWGAIAFSKNTLEGSNSRKSEAEEQISELEDKMVEITSEEQNKVKRMKRTEDCLKRPLGQYQTHQHSNYRGPRRRREKERV